MSALGRAVMDTVCYMNRTSAYAIHMKKLVLVGEWPYATKYENCENIDTSPITGTIVCCIPPSTPAVRAISTTCPADDPSCVTSPPSTETIGNVRQSLNHAKFAVRVSV